MKTTAATSGVLLGGSGLAAGEKERTKKNEIQLIEAGVSYEINNGDQDLSWRMPIDFAPNYLTIPEGILTTSNISEKEKNRLNNADSVVSNGRIHPIGNKYGGKSDDYHLPIKLRYGRQPTDVAIVKDEIDFPEYHIDRKESAVRVRTNAGSSLINSGEINRFELPIESKTLLKYEATKADGKAELGGEGDEARYTHKKHQMESNVLPKLLVRNRGIVKVWNQGDNQ